MKYLAVVMPPTIWIYCSTRKTFWADKFILSDMKNCGRRNVRRNKKSRKVNSTSFWICFWSLVSQTREKSFLWG